MEIKNSKISSTSHALTSTKLSSLPPGDSAKKSNMKILKLKGDRNVQINENIWTGDEKKAIEEKGTTGGFAAISQAVSDTHMSDKITAQRIDADSEVEVEVEAEGEYVTGVRSISVSTP